LLIEGNGIDDKGRCGKTDLEDTQLSTDAANVLPFEIKEDHIVLRKGIQLSE